MARTSRKSKVRRRARLLLEQGGLCGLCPRPIQHPETANLDHFVPRCAGGMAVEGNLMLVHPRCNRAKGEHNPEDR